MRVTFGLDARACLEAYGYLSAGQEAARDPDANLDDAPRTPEPEHGVITPAGEILRTQS